MTRGFPATLVDTDTLSAIMRRHPVARAVAQAYLVQHHQWTLSLITRYEILRGLYAKNAKTQLTAFQRLCAANRLLPLSEEIVVQAAQMYGTLHRQGTLIGDADILIAATAQVHGLVVATNNTRHFERISGVQVTNWLDAAEYGTI